MRYKYTDAQLIDAVNSSTSYRQVMLKLEIRVSGGSQSHLTSRIRRIGLDITHFKGQAWNLGIKRGPKKSSEQILVLRQSGIRQHGYILTRALLDIGRNYSCEICGVVNWNHLNLTLQVDHINRNWLDDRSENLRFLCPNCHSQVTKGVYPNLAEDRLLESRQ